MIMEGQLHQEQIKVIENVIVIVREEEIPQEIVSEAEIVREIVMETARQEEAIREIVIAMLEIAMGIRVIEMAEVAIIAEVIRAVLIKIRMLHQAETFNQKIIVVSQVQQT